MAQQPSSTLPSGSTNGLRNIAIVGAAGQIGKFIVSSLLAKNTFKITALARAESTTTPPSGVHVATIDYDNTDTIVEALKGQDALIITMSVRAPPGQSAKLIEGAAKAGVPWILPNEFGGDSDDKAGDDTGISAPKREDRALIDSLGISSWLAIASGFWYEYSLSGPGLYGIDITKREAVFFDDGKQRINTSTWPQTGRAIANLLSLPITAKDGEVSLSSYRNRFVFVSSFTINQREMLDAVQRVTGTADADWSISSVPAKERFQENQIKMRNGDHMAFAYALYARYFFPGENAGLPEVEHGLANDDLGLPKEDLDEFTKRAVDMAEDGYILKAFGLA